MAANILVRYLWGEISGSDGGDAPATGNNPIINVASQGGSFREGALATKVYKGEEQSRL